MDNQKSNKQPVVKIFSTPTCPYCFMAKNYLNQKQVKFEDFDVSQNQEKAMQMVNRSGEMGVPQLWIDDQVVIGFNKPEIDRLLKI